MEPCSYPWSVNRCRAQFRDDLGNAKTIQGTGFWVVLDSYLREYAFVTNRHNLDSSLELGTNFKIEKVEVELRQIDVEPLKSYAIRERTQFLVVDQQSSVFMHSRDADCSIIYPVIFQGKDEAFRPFSTFHVHNLANEDFFNRRVQMTDYCHFIGYPEDWWDRRYTSPIARFASIASSPEVYLGFEHPEVKTGDVVLVTGLSFGGSSGSPVVLDQKGIGTDYPGFARPKFIRKVSETGEAKQDETYHFVDEDFVPRTILGIMSGHCNESVGERMAHSGLSYFTRSTSILRLLQNNGLAKDFH